EVALIPPFAVDSGFVFQARTPSYVTVASDSVEQPTRSTLRLYEDGLPLGPAHALYDRIRDRGDGAFVHWTQVIYFSASDNSDPNNNGRRYTARFPVTPPAGVLLAPYGAFVLFVLLGAGYLLVRRRRAGGPPAYKPQALLTGRASRVPRSST